MDWQFGILIGLAFFAYGYLLKEIKKGTTAWVILQVESDKKDEHGLNLNRTYRKACPIRMTPSIGMEFSAAGIAGEIKRVATDDYGSIIVYVLVNIFDEEYSLSTVEEMLLEDRWEKKNK